MRGWATTSEALVLRGERGAAVPARSLSEVRPGSGAECRRGGGGAISCAFLASYGATSCSPGADMVLLAWGANSCGQLGLGCATEVEAKPREVQLGELLEGETVVEVVGGGAHTLLLTSYNRVLGCGSNISGQLGLGTLDRQLEFHVLGGEVGRVVTAAAGWDFSLLVNSEGAVWGAGGDAWGQLGRSQGNLCGDGVSPSSSGFVKLISATADRAYWELPSQCRTPRESVPHRDLVTQLEILSRTADSVSHPGI